MKLPARHSNRYFHDFKQRLEPVHVEDFFGNLSQKLDAAKSLADWEAALGYWNELKAHLDTHFELTSLEFYRNTQDAVIEAEEKRLRDTIEPVYKQLNAAARQRFLKSPERESLEKKLGSLFFKVLQLEEDAFDPENIALETQVNDLLAQYTKTTGNAELKVDGKVYPLSQHAKFSNSSDARLRRMSFMSYSGWFLDHRDELEEIYTKCTTLRNQMGARLGYADYTLLGYQKMRRLDYGPSEVAQFRTQIKEVLVPIARRIRDAQAKSQGEGRLIAWNTNYFPAWQVEDLKVKISEQIPAALKVYKSLSPRLAEYFQTMIDSGLIDLEARTGKAPGAFCTGFSDYRVPFIFLNSVGEGSDVTTMLHECGHAFQASASSQIDWIELRHPTLEACEVHSMSMEFLAYPYYEEFFHPEDASKYRKRHLAESLLILPYIAMVDEFQHRIYAGEGKTAEDRGKLWDALETEYNAGVDFSDQPAWRRHRWIRQLHIFHNPFYYIDYAIAQVGAWQLWMQNIENPKAAMENYLNLCALGGTRSLKDFFKAGNLVLPFEPGMLGELIEKVMRIEQVV